MGPSSRGSSRKKKKALLFLEGSSKEGLMGRMSVGYILRIKGLMKIMLGRSQ